MSVDTGSIGIAAADLMEAITDEYPDARLVGAGVLVDIGYEDEDGDDVTVIQWRFVDGEGAQLSHAHAGGIVHRVHRRLNEDE